MVTGDLAASAGGFEHRDGRDAEPGGAICRTPFAVDGVQRDDNAHSCGDHARDLRECAAGRRGFSAAGHAGSCSSSNRLSLAAKIGALSGANIVWWFPGTDTMSMRPVM